MRAFIHAADERLDDYRARLDTSDVEDGASAGGARTKNLAEKIEALRKKRGCYQGMVAQLDRIGEGQISLTDPDSRAMAAHTRVAVGYNAQVAVDAKHKLIVEQAVTNQVVDMGRLTQTAEPAREVLGGETIDVVADRGYFKIEGHRGLREDRLHSSCPQASTRIVGARGFLPQGRVPIRRGARRLCLPGREGADADPPRSAARSREDRLRQSRSLSDCPMRARCTNNVRSVSRLENEAVLDRMAERLTKRPEIVDRRREVVEHPFGSIKQWMNQGAFLMRGLETFAPSSA